MNQTSKIRTETLHFSIQGEFITDFAREMFWDMDKDYADCEEILLNILNSGPYDQEKNRRIAQDIIEGRLKFVGQDTVELVPDNENIRPIGQKIAETTKQLRLIQIQDHIRIHPMSYVDPYATCKSIREAPKSDDYDVGYQYLNDVTHYFTSPEYLNSEYQFPHHDEGTKLGLWLFEESELIYDLIGGIVTEANKSNFFEKLFDHINNHDFTGHGFAERQERYAAGIRREEDKITYMAKWEKETLEKIRQKQLKNDKSDPTERISLNDMTLAEFGAELLQRDHTNRDYDIMPDDIINWEGLISPAGKFYSCEFGGHSIKAFYVIQAYYEQFNYLDDNNQKHVFKSRSHVEEHIDTYNALDLLIQNNWIATRHLSYDYITAKDGARLTKAQKNCTWDAIVKHEIKLDRGMDLILD